MKYLYDTVTCAFFVVKWIGLDRGMESEQVTRGVEVTGVEWSEE